MKTTTIIIVDDHTLVRETWSFILNTRPGFAVVGEAGSAEEGIELIRSLRPDIVIMDINLPGMNGIEATGQLLQLAPLTKVLGVSLHSQPAYAKNMMKMGAMGYVTKNSSREEMFEAIGALKEGKKYVCQEIKDLLSEQLLSGEEAGGIHSLSTREKQVISRLRKGLSSKEISEELSVALKTVEVHRYNILRKLKLKNTAALINYINQSRVELVD